MLLNRTQQFLLEHFDQDLNDNNFLDLKFIISKFFYRKNNKLNNLELNSKLKESFAHLVSNIIHSYSSIIQQHSDNVNLFLWEEKLEYYKNFELFLDDILTENESTIQIELDTLVSELKKVINLQYILKKQIIN